MRHSCYLITCCAIVQIRKIKFRALGNSGKVKTDQDVDWGHHSDAEDNIASTNVARDPTQADLDAANVAAVAAGSVVSASMDLQAALAAAAAAGGLAGPSSSQFPGPC